MITETYDMIKSLVFKHPLVYYYTKSNAALAFKKLAAGLIGEDYEGYVNEKKSLFGNILKKLGFKK